MSSDDDRRLNLEAVDNIRWAVRQAQLRLLADPDPTDPWAFLVDPTIDPGGRPS